jgi:outer membrane protein assembly factor BamE (lipoprotein component of BamABCDE complex)
MRNPVFTSASVFIACCSLAGCLIIPTDFYKDYSRKNIAEEPPSAIIPGKTTREDVLLSLGEPDKKSQDEPEFWYTSTKVKAIWGTYGGGGEYIKNYIHIISFDKNGLVEALRLYDTADNRNQLQNDELGTRRSLVTYTPEPHFSKAPIVLPAKVE